MSLPRRAFTLGNTLLSGLPAPCRTLALRGLATAPLHWRRPGFLIVEATNVCALRCPLCPIGAGLSQRPRGFMPLAPYRTLIDELSAHVRRILIDYAGEPLMHPQIGEMVEISTRAGIATTVGTNGNVDRFAEIVAAGVDEVLFSLDGITEETYQAYRIGGSLRRALPNLETLVRLRDARGDGKPRIVVQLVVMRHNEHEIPAFLHIARDLGADAAWLQPVCVNDFFREDVGVLRERYLPTVSQITRYDGRGRDARTRKPMICEWPLQAVILHNGDVSVCCFDGEGKHLAGNAFAAGGFAKVWRGPAYRRLRGQIIRRELPLCGRCDITVVAPTEIDLRDPHAVAGYA